MKACKTFMWNVCTVISSYYMYTGLKLLTLASTDVEVEETGLVQTCASFLKVQYSFVPTRACLRVCAFLLLPETGLKFHSSLASYVLSHMS